MIRACLVNARVAEVVLNRDPLNFCNQALRVSCFLSEPKLVTFMPEDSDLILREELRVLFPQEWRRFWVIVRVGHKHAPQVFHLLLLRLSSVESVVEVALVLRKQKVSLLQ